jgi:hypothetical protein
LRPSRLPLFGAANIKRGRDDPTARAPPLPLIVDDVVEEAAAIEHLADSACGASSNRMATARSSTVIARAVVSSGQLPLST